MNYSDLQLHPDLAKGIALAGYIECMPVQEAVFPYSFAGEDIYAQSQTGTGKTAAFLVSIFQRIMTKPECRTKKVLILSPTRELAVQIEEEAEKLGKFLPIKSGCFYGGVAYGAQFELLKSNVQMIIGTPGRIIDLVKQGKMLLNEVGFLVVDEADRMFDMGFIDDLRKLIRYLPATDKRQTFLFSATLNFRIKDLAWEYMKTPKEIVIEADKVTVDLVSQELYHVGSDEKFRLLLGILNREHADHGHDNQAKSAIIFCNQKFMAAEVAKRLHINGYACEFIMGDLPQSKRLKIIESTKNGLTSILVATDVAARGLDINDLDMVINYDLPMEAESYVHRIGRTARAGAKGKAISLACEKFVYGLPAIEKYIEQKIPVMPITEELLVTDKSEGINFNYNHDKKNIDYQSKNKRTASRQSSKTNTHFSPRQKPRRSAVKRSEEVQQRTQKPISKAARNNNSSQNIAKRQSNNIQNPYAMSSEERMKFYKEKYANKSITSDNAKSNKAKKEKVTKEISQKKKSIFDRIKELFKKKE